MLNLLIRRECCVCEVMQVLGISQTRASRNLNLLYDAGFLKLRMGFLKGPEVEVSLIPIYSFLDNYRIVLASVYIFTYRFPKYLVVPVHLSLL
jgi:DNA-binding transcriptional ArsR family regulator